MEAVIFIGVQAVGKSSFFKERFFKTHIRLNLDMLRTRHREAILLRACLEAKQRFVVDNTNPTVEDRARYIAAAKAARFRVVGYYFQSSLKDALARNETRPEPERIPAAGIRAAFRRLQLPTFEEGFDSLYYVRIGENGDFAVTEWVEERNRDKITSD